MSYRVGTALVAAALSFSAPAFAQSLPAVQLSPTNLPRQCTTPGRLLAFLRARNPNLHRKFDQITVDYVRHGRDLGIRWDYAFFQMILETNSLKFTGDVSIRQNNFAGLGATGGGVKGESFKTVSDGVRAHLQHLMIYAGMHVANPVADRTRKVQSWGILKKWRRKFRHPITFGDVGSKWAPVDRKYGADIQSIAEAFYVRSCNRHDPYPELIAAALGSGAQFKDQAASPPRRRPQKYSRDRAALGASNIRKTETTPSSYRMINKGSTNQRNAAAKFAAPAIKPSPQAPKCRVWTASYGGQIATIIRSSADDTTNYTVLDVNKGREDAEAQAYITAYAKGGRRVGNFPSKAAAMAKAFKLCPKK